MKKIIFLNIGWMNNYRGLTGGDKISGGGEYVDKYKYGHEIFNFLPDDENLYGFVETPSIHIERIGARRSDSSVSGVLVIWTAKHPKIGGNYIVGWYENALVYRYRVENPVFLKNRSFSTLPSYVNIQPDDIGKHAAYFVSADEKDCHLVETQDRKLSLPKGKGGKGRSSIWYAQDENNKVFIEKLFDYIKTEQSS